MTPQMSVAGYVRSGPVGQRWPECRQARLQQLIEGVFQDMREEVQATLLPAAGVRFNLVADGT